MNKTKSNLLVIIESAACPTIYMQDMVLKKGLSILEIKLVMIEERRQKEIHQQDPILIDLIHANLVNN